MPRHDIELARPGAQALIRLFYFRQATRPNSNEQHVDTLDPVIFDVTFAFCSLASALSNDSPDRGFKSLRL
jgi:hypothetical protein